MHDFLHFEADRVSDAAASVKFLDSPASAQLVRRLLASRVRRRIDKHLRDSLSPKYSEPVYNGFWFSPEREALQALVTETEHEVTGVVRLKLYKGNIIVAGRKSPKSLYDPKIATMEGDESSYDQNDTTGFIRLNALRRREIKR